MAACVSHKDRAGPMLSAPWDGPCPVPPYGSTPRARGTRWPVAAGGSQGTCWCHRVPHRARDLLVSLCAPRSLTPSPRPIGTQRPQDCCGVSDGRDGDRDGAGDRVCPWGPAPVVIVGSLSWTMLILTCPAQLQRLEGALRRSLPLTLPVMGGTPRCHPCPVPWGGPQCHP